jgi:hypothetical protein
MGRPAHRALLRNALPDLTTIVPPEFEDRRYTPKNRL